MFVSVLRFVLTVPWFDLQRVMSYSPSFFNTTNHYNIHDFGVENTLSSSINAMKTLHLKIMDY